jgi:ribosome modulation factor
MKTPYQKGIHAAIDGKLRFENPYPKSMVSHWSWLAGWVAYKERMGAIVK